MKKYIQLIFFGLSILFSQTNEQVKKAQEIIKRNNISDQQVINAAKSKGYSDAQIKKVLGKEKSPSSKSFNKNNFEITDDQIKVMQNSGTKVRSNNEIAKIKELDVSSKSNISIDNEILEYFGYNIFKSDPSLFQSNSFGAVDPNYLIGPGDDIIVMLWGETQFRQVFKVDIEGFLFIPEIGQVFVNGLDLSLLESKIFKVFSQFYASLNPQMGTPTTFLDVSLGNLRPLRVQVLGEVAQPGAFTVGPSATLFSSLYYFNGPTINGSLREIQLIRNGNVITTIDFYDYLFYGSKPNDQKLQLDDVIFIPRRMKTVTIQGEINRDGIYELLPDENFLQLIKIAGGLKSTAFTKHAQIDRIVPFDQRDKKNAERMIIDLENILNKDNSISLQDGDLINIFPILEERRNIVEINGAVVRPGKYELQENMNISLLIKKAGNLLGDAYLDRADIVRLNPDKTEELIQFDLKKVMNKHPESDLFLENLDIIRIYEISEMIEQKSVSIVGYVKNPGEYYLKDGMTAYDLIFMSGGLLDKAFMKSMFLDRGDIIRLNNDGITSELNYFNLGLLLEGPSSENNFHLRDGDILRLYNKNLFIANFPVTINGIIKNPGEYDFKKNMTLGDLILESGGLIKNTFKYKVEIARIDTLSDNLNDYAEVFIFDIINNSFSDTHQNLGKVDFKLEPFDLISLRPDPFFQNQKTVLIEGEILFPGEYTILSSDEKISDILKRAGGLTKNAYLEASSFERNEKKILISMNNIFKNESLNFKIENNDKIIIGSAPNTVFITGEVNAPGYHSFNPGKRLNYYIAKAGGCSPNADVKNIWIDYPNGISKKLKGKFLISPVVLDGSVISVGVKEQEEPFDKTEFASEISSIIANLAQAITIIFLAMK
jgi:polysaccharide biosynthesis/export protein